jgi:hypothetical protein
VATRSPNKKIKIKIGGRQMVSCNLTWNDLVATKFPSEKEKKNKKTPSGGHQIDLRTVHVK